MAAGRTRTARRRCACASPSSRIWRVRDWRRFDTSGARSSKMAFSSRLRTCACTMLRATHCETLRPGRKSRAAFGIQLQRYGFTESSTVSGKRVESSCRSRSMVLREGSKPWPRRMASNAGAVMVCGRPGIARSIDHWRWRVWKSWFGMGGPMVGAAAMSKPLSHRERGWGEGNSPRGLRSPLTCPPGILSRRERSQRRKMRFCSRMRHLSYAEVWTMVAHPSRMAVAMSFPTSCCKTLASLDRTGRRAGAVWNARCQL